MFNDQRILFIKVSSTSLLPGIANTYRLQTPVSYRAIVYTPTVLQQPFPILLRPRRDTSVLQVLWRILENCNAAAPGNCASVCAHASFYRSGRGSSQEKHLY